MHKLLPERALYSAKHIATDRKFVEQRNSQLKNPLVLFQPLAFDVCLLLSTDMKNSNTARASNNPALPKYSEQQRRQILRMNVAIGRQVTRSCYMMSSTNLHMMDFICGGGQK